MRTQTQRLEALLFTAGEAVARDELLKLLDCSAAELDQAMGELEQELTGHGLTLIKTENHIQLVTSTAVAEFLSQFTDVKEQTLSRAAAETLAVLAYRGPMSRYEVDMIRGVDSRSMIRQLLQRGLVRRIQSAGKTPLYDITEEFLAGLGMQKREQLPDFDSLATHEAVIRVLREKP